MVSAAPTDLNNGFAVTPQLFNNLHYHDEVVIFNRRRRRRTIIPHSSLLIPH